MEQRQVSFFYLIYVACYESAQKDSEHLQVVVLDVLLAGTAAVVNMVIEQHFFPQEWLKCSD